MSFCVIISGLDTCCKNTNKNNFVFELLTIDVKESRWAIKSLPFKDKKNAIYLYLILLTN